METSWESELAALLTDLLAVQDELPAEDTRTSAEAALPEAVTQNHDRVFSRGFIFLGQKETAHSGLDPEDVEVIPADDVAPESFVSSLGADIEWNELVREHVGKERMRVPGHRGGVDPTGLCFIPTAGETGDRRQLYCKQHCDQRSHLEIDLIVFPVCWRG